MAAAIETRYSGCRFRSRLEARWAMFFDHMGLRWSYEPEGFQWESPLVRAPGGSWETSTMRYLPDFWLPDLGSYAEVKGFMSDEDAYRIGMAIEYRNVPALSEHGILILPELPAPASGVLLATHLQWREGVDENLAPVVDPQFELTMAGTDLSVDGYQGEDSALFKDRWMRSCFVAQCESAQLGQMTMGALTSARSERFGT